MALRSVILKWCVGLWPFAQPNGKQLSIVHDIPLEVRTPRVIFTPFARKALGPMDAIASQALQVA